MADNIGDISPGLSEVAVPGPASIPQGGADPIVDSRLEILDLRVQRVIGER